MAYVFKCKCCTANLDVEEGMYIVECDYCGSKQTVPSSRDENIQNLFNRATTLRLKSEFDKAEQVYERIIQADGEQAEAYWGLILCKYGVEYVEDPKTMKRIPTCHRTSYESVIADENYKLTLKYAYDVLQKSLYEEEAKAIDKVQKNILAVAQNEEPFDVFICYKETDANGKRTQDSVIANDIYHQLTQEGFRVFYAAITLEGKLGSAYEPIIFSALNSAKVMLAIGTKPEYFNAVWVKNEWSRFIKMNKDDRSKLLIPCYKNMDAYDLPDEFAHLQAQDMSKIGFINDIVRGIKKVLNKNDNQTANASSGNAGVNTSNLLKRAYIFLENRDWGNTNTYCEKVLDLDPENAEAYLCKLLVELRFTSKEELADCTSAFETRFNYKKAHEYGDADMRRFLDEILTKAKSARDVYSEKCALSSIAKNDFASAERYIKEISNAETRHRLVGFLKDAHQEAANYKIYQNGKKLQSDGSYEEAIQEFEKILTFKDSTEQIQNCKDSIAKRNLEKAETLRRQEEAARLQAEKERLKELERLAAIKKAKIKKLLKVLIPLGLALILVLSIVISAVTCTSDRKARNYCKLELSEDKSYYIVTGLNNGHDTNLVIPETYKGKPIKEINLRKEDIVSVVVPNGVTTIINFIDCTSLVSVELPDTVTRIGNYAFSGCWSLTTINIPYGVTYIGKRAFSKCDDLKTIIIPTSVTFMGEEAFFYTHNVTIYCKAESQPSEWASNWNQLYGFGEHCPVVWGYNG